MSDASVTTTDNRFGELFGLMRTAAGSRHFGDLAGSFTRDAELLVTEVTALAAPRTARHLAQMRRRASAAARQARSTQEEAARAADAIRDALVAGTAAERRTAARRVASSGERARRSIHSTHRHAAVVGRLAAGIASRHESCDGPEPIWSSARRLLGNLAIGPGDDDLTIASPAGAGRTFLTGLLAHAGWQAPAYVVLTADDGSDRYVQAMVDRDSLVVESVADERLAPDQRMSPAERRALVRLGYQPPDGGHDNWWQERPYISVAEVADLVADTLTEVHGIRGIGVTATIGLAAHHPAIVDPADHPAALELDYASVPSLAEALADRVGTWIDDLGVDAVWASVTQPDSPHYANLGSNLDGGLFTEVSGEDLNAQEVTHLLALGWSAPDRETGNHTRVWPAPFDLAAACWHVALTLVAVHGLQLDEPVLATVEPFG